MMRCRAWSEIWGWAAKCDDPGPSLIYLWFLDSQIAVDFPSEEIIDFRMTRNGRCLS